MLQQDFKSPVGQVAGRDIINKQYRYKNPTSPQNSRCCPQCKDLTWSGTQCCIHCGFNLFAHDMALNSETNRGIDFRLSCCFALIMAAFLISELVLADDGFLVIDKKVGIVSILGCAVILMRNGRS